MKHLYRDELDLALRLTRAAGDILKTFYEIPPVVHLKDDHEPVTEADRAANAFLVAQLAQAFPQDGILAEESNDDLTRLSRKRVWIVDPLDGTTEFIAHNGEFCVMVGLIENGRPVVGAIHHPATGATYGASAGGGAFVEELGERYPLQASTNSDLHGLRPLVSRSHHYPSVDTIVKALGTQKERAIGSTGLKSVVLARGEADFYIHPGAGTKEWDTCAPQILLEEAGGTMTDCWNRPLTYNQRDIARRYGVMASNTACQSSLAEATARVLDQIGIDPDFGFMEMPVR